MEDAMDYTYVGHTDYNYELKVWQCENGFIVERQSKKYVFTSTKELNAWTADQFKKAK